MVKILYFYRNKFNLYLLVTKTLESKHFNTYNKIYNTRGKYIRL